MTYPDPDARIQSPIPVEIKNWAPPIKLPVVRRTTVRTYVLDPTGATGAGKYVQISDYEPNRLRMAIVVTDAPTALTTSVPPTSPDASSATAANNGAFLPVSTVAYELFGPDAFWLNSLGTIGRVTVIKEFGE